MNRLRELREEAGLSLRELGKKVEMNASVLGNYERGDRQPKTEIRDELAAFFKVSTPYIMGISTDLSENEIVISKQEYERLKAIEAKFNQVKDLVAN